MGSLSNLYISQSYISLIHLGSDTTATSTLVELQDGLGNGIGVSVNTNGDLSLEGSLTASLQEGYVWVGDDNGKTKLVATASFAENTDLGPLNAFTASQIPFNASATASIVALQNFSSSLDANFVTEGELAAATASLISQINTKLNTSSFNSYTASTDSSISQLNASSASQQISINALNTNSASVNTSITNVNSATASLFASINSLNSFTASIDTNFVSEVEFAAYTSSNDGKVNSLIAATASYANSASVASVDAAQQAQINSLTSATSSYANSASFAASQLVQDGRLNNLESTSASVNTSISNLNTFTQSQAGVNVLLAGEIDSLQAKTGSYATTGSNVFTADQTIIGTLNVDTINAVTIHTIIESSSVIFSSGSNLFGDELTDTQTLSGSVKVQGSLTVNGTPVLTSSVDISGLVTTSSFNAYTQSNDSKVNSLIAATASYADSASVAASQLVQDGRLNNLESATSSYANSASVAAIDSAQQSQINSLQAATASYANSASVSTLVSQSITNISASLTLTDQFLQAQITALDPSGSGFDFASINAFTASQLIVNSGYNTFTQSADQRLDSIEAQSGSWVTSAITASSLITASLSGQTLTFTKGDASTFNISIPDVSGSDVSALNAFTASQLIVNSGYNTFTQSIQSEVDSLQAATASYALSASVAAVDAAQQVSINALNTNSASVNTSISNLNSTTASLNSSVTQLNASSASQQISINALNVFTASQSTASIETSIDNLNSFSASTLTRLTNIESTTASLNSSITQLNASSASQQSQIDSLIAATGSVNTSLTSLNSFTASQSTINSGVNTFTSSANQRLTAIESVSGSWVTESETASFARTNVSNTFTETQTINADLNVSGTINAYKLNVLIESSSVIYSSGSNQFGDAANDTQTLYGSTNVVNELTASGLHYPTADNGEKSFIQTDGNGNLSLQYVDTIFEAFYAGESLPKGTPLYFSGSQGANPIARAADASNPAKMPVILIANENLTAGNVYEGVVLGLIEGIDLTGYTAGQSVYVAEGGGWSTSLPSGSNSITQALGIVTKAGNGGKGLVLNPGPAQLPGLRDGYAWVGNSGNQPIAVATSSFAENTDLGPLNAFTQSAQAQLTSLTNATSSYVTSTITASLLVTASFDNGTRNLTFTKGDATTFNVNIPDVSGSTGNFATTGSNTFTGSQTITGSLLVSGDEISLKTIGSDGFNPELLISGEDQESRISMKAFAVTMNIEGTALVVNNSQVNGGIQLEGPDPQLNFRDTTSPNNPYIAITATNQRLEVADEFGTIATMNTASFNIPSASFTASLQQGYVWVGNASGKSTTVATSSFGSTINTGSFATTGSNTFVGQQNIAEGNKIGFGTTPNDVYINSPFEGGFISRNLDIINYSTAGGVTNILANNDISLNSGNSNINITGKTGVNVYGNTFISGGLNITGSLTASLQQGYVWVGDGNNKTTLVATSSFAGGGTINTGSFATTGSNTFNGNQTINGIITTDTGINVFNPNANVRLAANANSSGSQYANYDIVIAPNVYPGDIYSGYGIIREEDLVDGKTFLGFVANSYSPQYGPTTVPMIIAAGDNPDASDTAIIFAPDGTAEHYKNSSFKYNVDITGNQIVSGSLGASLIYPTNSKRNITFFGGQTFSSSLLTNTSYLNAITTSANTNDVNIAFPPTVGIGNATGSVTLGSNNIVLSLGNNNAINQGARRQLIGNQNIVQNAASLNTSALTVPVVSNNYLGSFVNLTFTTGSSAGNNAHQITNNLVLGPVTINHPSASIAAAGSTTVASNINVGNINSIASGSLLSNSSLFNNNINGHPGLILRHISSSITTTNNIIAGGGAMNINNSYFHTGSNNTFVVSANILSGQGVNINAGGSPSTNAARTFVGNLIGGQSVNISLEAVATDLGSLRNSVVYGHNLTVTGSHSAANAATQGAAFLGRWNSLDNGANDSARTIFAVGTGTAAGTRKTGFLIDSGSNSFFEGTVNVNGNLVVSGSGVTARFPIFDSTAGRIKETLAFTGSRFVSNLSMSVDMENLNENVFGFNQLALGDNQTGTKFTLDTNKGVGYTELKLNAVYTGSADASVMVRNTAGVRSFTVNADTTSLNGDIKLNRGSNKTSDIVSVNSSLTVSNSLVTSNSIILVTTQNGSVGGVEYPAVVMNKGTGTFDIVHNYGGNLDVGYLIINPTT